MNPFAVAATLAYGILAIVAVLVAASIAGSVLGAALAFAAAGLTYIFQMLVLLGKAPRLQLVLWALVVVALLLSVLVSLGAA